MTVIDLGNNVVVNQQFNPASTTATANATAVDVDGYAYAIICIQLGDLHATETVTFSVQSAATNGGTYTTCDKLGSDAGSADASTAALSNAADNTQLMISVNLNHTQSFLRVRAVHSGSNAQIYGVNMVLMPTYTGDADTPSFSI
tara:strand:+ start:5607 stop:6041 length:435 start_codon:yes stop_codon:yes gene_type:complete